MVFLPCIAGTVNAETVPHRFLQHLERVTVEVYISSDLPDSASLKAAIEVEAEELLEKKVGLRTPSEEGVVLFIRVRSFPMERSATDKKILAVRAELWVKPRLQIAGEDLEVDAVVWWREWAIVDEDPRLAASAKRMALDRVSSFAADVSLARKMLGNPH